jgi:hypothetical protein
MRSAAPEPRPAPPHWRPIPPLASAPANTAAPAGRRRARTTGPDCACRVRRAFRRSFATPCARTIRARPAGRKTGAWCTSAPLGRKTSARASRPAAPPPPAPSRARGPTPAPAGTSDRPTPGRTAAQAAAPPRPTRRGAGSRPTPRRTTAAGARRPPPPASFAQTAGGRRRR